MKEETILKHPIIDRFLILLCALCVLSGAAAIVALLVGVISFDMINEVISNFIPMFSEVKVKVIVALVAAGLVLFAFLLLGALLPRRKKRSSSFAYQHNENGMVRISLKAIETLVQKCTNQHAELKVVTSSLFSDEQSVVVDIHITLQTDISMPMAVTALQKQIKRYLEACAGITVKEVRVYVDGTMPATEDTAQSPFVLPMSLLGIADFLPSAQNELPAEVDCEVTIEPTVEEQPVEEAVVEDAVVEEAVAEEEKVEA